jgi:hypothetical protein
MVEIVARIAAMSAPLDQKLLLLRERSAEGGQMERLVRWAAGHPEIAGGVDWCSRVWWGAAAGEVVRAHLYDPRRRGEALALLESADWSPLDKARSEAGVIVVAAHLGPPKFLMNLLLDRSLPLLVWTNTRDLPPWLAARSGASFLDPLEPDQRSLLLVKSALHLRGGGVVLGAADHASGERTVSIDRLGVRWKFALGLPTLCRRLGLPAVVALAGWSGERIRVSCQLLEPPAPALSEDDWNRGWLDRYWACIEQTVRREPENLRFLRWAVERLVPPPGDADR